jgi:dTDP-4-amino-4,6-dideoxygalactose transaminase
MHREVLSLPMGPHLSDEQVATVIEAVETAVPEPIVSAAR